jgi:hypothetical protein
MSNWYYLKNRKPVPYDCELMTEPKKWAKLNNKHFNEHTRMIRKTYFSNCHVSTVFLGLDHNYLDGKPILFETMIFGVDNDSYQTRCSTHREALKMHWQAVNEVKGIR